MLGRLQNGLRLGISRQCLLPRWASLTTNPPVVPLPENEFSKAEDEALQKVVAERTKDDPIPEMKNPFEKEKVKCILCSMDITPNYKNLRLLSQFVSSYTGKVYGRHITGLCKAKQGEVEREIMKARGVGMMPYLMKNVKFLKDPALYDPEKPLRPHRF
jgi:small subunit ribosomal protein S18